MSGQKLACITHQEHMSITYYKTISKIPAVVQKAAHGNIAQSYHTA
jgi:hypothetical protein